MKITATNNCVWVIREIPEFEKNGILIPDSAKRKAQRGKIITVGKLVTDKTIIKDATAIFNMTSGFDIEIDGEVYVVLRDIDIIGVV